MKDWKKLLVSKNVIEEYRFAITANGEPFEFCVRYVKRNGYTTLKVSPGNLSPDLQSFAGWLSLMQTSMGTRYDKPHWYTRIRFRRKKKLAIWALEAMQVAYSAWAKEQEHIASEKLKKAS